MSGARHRRKGNRVERELVAYLRERGFAAERIPLSGSAGGSFIGDVTIPLLGRDFVAEVKVRGNDFGRLYSWLADRDLLIVRADRGEPLVIAPLKLAADIVAAAEHGRKSKTATDIRAQDGHATALMPENAEQYIRELVRRIMNSLHQAGANLSGPKITIAVNLEIERATPQLRQRDAQIRHQTINEIRTRVRMAPPALSPWKEED
jgi:hypothetical protein